MANYMKVDVEKLETDLTAVADAIRAKTGKTDLLALEQMPEEIRGIELGGSGVEANVTIGSSNGYIDVTYKEGDAYVEKTVNQGESISFKLNVGDSFLIWTSFSVQAGSSTSAARRISGTGVKYAQNSGSMSNYGYYYYYRAYIVTVTEAFADLMFE